MSDFEQFERIAFWLGICLWTFIIVALSVVGLILHACKKSNEQERLQRIARTHGDGRESGYTATSRSVEDDLLFDAEFDGEADPPSLSPGRLTNRRLRGRPPKWEPIF